MAKSKNPGNYGPGFGMLSGGMLQRRQQFQPGEEITMPCGTRREAEAMRFEWYGYCKALQCTAGREEEYLAVALYECLVRDHPPRLILRPKDNNEMSKKLAAAAIALMEEGKAPLPYRGPEEGDRVLTPEEVARELGMPMPSPRQTPAIGSRPAGAIPDSLKNLSVFKGFRTGEE